jgi:hypothetical protein
LAVWESEEWLQEHVKPLAQSGGMSGSIIFSYFFGLANLRLYKGVQGRLAAQKIDETAEPEEKGDEAMEE